MKSTSILLAEDDVNLGNLLKNYLAAKDFDTSLFTNGNLALKAFPEAVFQLCIIDIMMPEMDGLTLAKRIRQINPQVPIIFLTAKSQKEDILEGFRTGADDYITKPFSMEELLYRIQAVLKRTSASITSLKEEKYTIGKYTFDSVKQLLLFEDESVKLTTKESELLELLCRHGGTILERNFALKTIWTDDNYFNARSMDVYITKLRKYLKKDPSVRILNIHGKGYKLLT
ncbi:MAG TPA: response regulator transcription factor [Bacteroidales bacterium]|jgi:DNA-binding response OmpR family regulator|nr:response regulator [Bacteroidales bacterium]OQB62337.1 MAG: Sensory transduction protein regX3 [Bacteroidetes bacterium ADurb.Bin145]NMD02261.1 response regulator transcription factor [Bacteroidales bacterium]HOU02509.1 response regulator transcription factor [Bacteroidales bacterium]HQG62667.1 response regulator transcription factor [Bacteroidales bacterium]